jgi:phenylacetate-CoA oxygenase PaaH subunit
MGPRHDPRRTAGRVTVPRAPKAGPNAAATAVVPAPSAGPAAPPPLEAWEVFRQEKDGDPMRHGGSVMAPDAELATHYARELFGRRQESVRLWIVRRVDVLDLHDPDLLQPPLDRSFKKPGGYVMRDKLAAARAAAGQAKSSGGWRRGAPPPTSEGSGS